jgi:flagellar hook assembly protein FlgD
VPASKLILGVPYYGRAWSTDSSALDAANISGTKNGASTTVVYSTAYQYALDHGRRWDPLEGVAWTAYRRQNCTARYGCVNPWRELYYDDAAALGRKYDLVNRYNLRGAGIWALGYDGTRPELHTALKAKFITDTIPPKITGATISNGFVSPNGDGRMDTTTMRVAVTGQITFGWSVQPYANGVAGAVIRKGSMAGKYVAFTWDGKDSRGAIVPDGPYRISIWTADASGNQATISRVVTVDRRPAVVAVSSSSSFISPNGDGRWDQTTLSTHADEAITGTARVKDRTGATVRKWTISAMTAGSWVWDGRDLAGRMVADDRYTFQVDGLDRAGNRTVSQRTVGVDRTIRSISWSRVSFVPRAGQTDRMTLSLSRSATVTVSIYQGATLVRSIWTRRTFAAGSYVWTWNGRTSAGALARPGPSTAVVDATSWIGSSRSTRVVTVIP